MSDIELLTQSETIAGVDSCADGGHKVRHPKRETR
jgi:hypothetical protein